ncbi:MAG: cupin domain-containing protein [Lachnospiraceae bacterium]|nr:cupin domain-containing protein [Lachnospiraceae bacterium]
MNPRIEVVPHCEGGQGQVTFRHLTEKHQMNEACLLYAEVTVYPGSSVGWHVHKGESETYYILSGTAEYNDNGKVRRVYPGETTYTPDGFGHEIKPFGKEPLVFMALLLKT